MNMLTFSLSYSILVIGLYILLRLVLKRMLRPGRRWLRGVGVLALTVLTGFAVVRIFSLVAGTGFSFEVFATGSESLQAEILAVHWAGKIGLAWAGLLLDDLFLFFYTATLMFAWAWTSASVADLNGHGLVKILSGLMLVVSFIGGCVDLAENTALEFLLAGYGLPGIRAVAALAGQWKWFPPLLSVFSLPAALVWLYTTRKALRKIQETAGMKKSLKRMKAADPTKLFLGPVIGGMTSASGGAQAKLWAKARDEGRLYAWIGRKADLTDAPEPVGIAAVKAENGFAAVIPLTGLPAGTTWHYALTLSDTPPGKEGRSYPSFTVYPSDGEAEPFNFYFGSCFRPEFPLPDKNDVLIFRSIREGKEKDHLKFGLMIGDQVYADVIGHNGLDKIPETAAEYRRVYAHSWTQPDLRALLADLPVYMTIDDHEVDDDWRWVDMKKGEARNPLWVRLERWVKRITPRNISLDRMTAALQAGYEHQFLHAPDLTLYPAGGPNQVPSLIPTGDESDPGGACYTFTYGAAAFFVLDVRTRRTWRLFGEKKIMDEPQWRALGDWLKNDSHPLKFIVSSSGILMRYWYDLIYDRWGAYKKDRERIINLIAENDLENVCILSGDVHTANAVTAELEGSGGRRLILREFCASPFQQESGWLKQYGFDTRPFARVRKITFHHKAVLQPNYGVVKVGFEAGQPQVRFEIRDAAGKVLAAS